MSTLDFTHLIRVYVCRMVASIHDTLQYESPDEAAHYSFKAHYRVAITNSTNLGVEKLVDNHRPLTVRFIYTLVLANFKP